MRRVFLLIGCLLAAVACTQPVNPPAGPTGPTTPTGPTGQPVSAPGDLGPPVGPVVNAAKNSSCGTELWAKKTLADSQAGQVDTTPISISTVAQLNAVPDTGAQGSARVGIELHTWQFTGTVVEARIESDSDFHVVMRDSTGKTLVTEYPLPACAADSAPAARIDIASARAAFAAACGKNLNSLSFTTLNGTATVVGVGFYDRDHGQTGRDYLGNGSDAELHPVLSFKGSCP